MLCKYLSLRQILCEMRKIFLSVLWWMGCAAVVFSQTAREEIMKNPALAAGKYYAYEAPVPDKVSQAPKGYEPFYISAFARHGSRYLTDEEKYAEPVEVLRRAAQEGYLSADGQKALRVAESLWKEAEDRYGELTPKGAAQHQGLVSRMYRHYPQVFVKGAHVDARATYKTRAFLSMAAACVRLAQLNGGLVITQDASAHDAYYIKYKNKNFEQQHLAQADSVYRVADSVYVHPDRLMAQLFTKKVDAAVLGITPTALMCDLFELDGISQSSYGQEGLSFLFTADERYDLWQRNNFEWYYEKGASPLSQQCMYQLERNLLANFVTTADTVIASAYRCVTLRYGHDTNLAPLAALMGMDRLQKATTDWQRIADTYRTYRIIPMCGNIQLIFYRRKGSSDILVKPLLNEREVTLPVPTDCAPFYHWSDVRAYWLKVVGSIRLPEPGGQGD